MIRLTYPTYAFCILICNAYVFMMSFDAVHIVFRALWIFWKTTFTSIVTKGLGRF